MRPSPPTKNKQTKLTRWRRRDAISYQRRPSLLAAQIQPTPFTAFLSLSPLAHSTYSLAVTFIVILETHNPGSGLTILPLVLLFPVVGSPLTLSFHHRKEKATLASVLLCDVHRKIDLGSSEVIDLSLTLFTAIDGRKKAAEWFRHIKAPSGCTNTHSSWSWPLTSGAFQRNRFHSVSFSIRSKIL